MGLIDMNTQKLIAYCIFYFHSNPDIFSQINQELELFKV